MHAILCGAGHNLRLILAYLRVLLLALFGVMAMTSLIIPRHARPTRAALRR
jgi:hypothetical protein